MPHIAVRRNMRSSEDSEGFKLLNKWNTSGAEIGISFAGIGEKLSISGTGVIVAFDKEALRFTGAGFELFLELSGAAFDKVGTEEIFKRSGLDPSLYSESAEIWLESGDRVTFFKKRRGAGDTSPLLTHHIHRL
jgi:hypothetical protein